MIAGLSRYSETKDSGVPALGNVPKHWQVQPVGRIGQLFKGNGGNKGDEVPVGVPCVRYGDLYTRHEFFIRSTRAHVSEERATEYTPIRYGDVLFAASGETIEDIGRSAVNLIDADARCGGDILVLRLNVEIVPEFLGYAADSAASRHQKARMGRGFTVVHVYGGHLKRLAIAFPPLPEQAAIVRFLDHADRRIRRYIRAKQKLIKLLEEQKQAIIHRAVTRGLDPDVRLKPSGVEWLGEVPEHWEVRRLGRNASVFNGATPSRMKPAYWADGTIPWLSSGKVNDYVIESPSELVTERALRECSISIVPKGAVVIGLVGQGKTRGKSALLGIDTCINQNMAAIVPRAGLSGSYLHHFLTAFYKTLREFGRGGNQEALNCEIVANWRVANPPIDEQTAICDTLRRDVLEVQSSERRVRRVIEMLQEYRTRLIADVVTGKLDVREVAARLPDEPEEPEPLDEVDDESAAEEPVDDFDPIPEEAEA